MELRFSTLGPVAVYDRGSPLHLGGAQRRALVARLLVAPNRLVGVETLLADCWGERVTKGSRATLASHVSQLRKVVGADRLTGRDGGYLLRVEDRESDAACFARELEGARGVLAQPDGDPADALRLLETALARWHGPALADVADRDWASPEAARLDGLRDLARETLIDAVLSAGDHERAVALADAAVREQPLREHRTVQLMLALYRSGRQLEALQAYQRTRRVLAEEFGIEPSAALSTMETSVLRHDPRLDLLAPRSSVVERPAHRSPVSADGRAPLVGRADELATLTSALSERRIATLVGPGGVGKTRLALEAVVTVEQRFADGSTWVDLAHVHDSADVPAVVATALNVPPRPHGDLEAAVLDHLSDAQRLLVLDNCEHVLDGVGELVDRVRTRCPAVTVLATSREALGVPGEAIWTLSPLDPADGCELFECRALEADATLRFDARDRALIAEICTLADGLPLAIEIAAAHARILSLADIAREPPEEFPARIATRVPERQRGLAATIEWSWRLLSEEERALFAHMSIFPAGCDRAAVQAVAMPSSSATVTRRSLDRLVETSLVAVDRTGPGTRYRMLHAVRECARREAAQGAVTPELRRRHGLHYADLARALGTAARAAGPNDTARSFVEEWDNLRAACGWALSAEELDAVVALVTHTGDWAIHAMRTEHSEWTMQALDLADALGRPDPALLVTAAEWAYWSDQRDRALELAGEAARLAPAASAPAAAAWVRIAYVHARMDAFAAAATALGHAEDALECCGDPFTFLVGHAILHGVVGIVSPQRRDEHARMIRCAGAELDNPLAHALVGRAVVSDLLFSGSTDEAMAELGPALEAARAVGAVGLEADLTILSLAPLPLGDSEAPPAFRATIARLKASGYAQLVDVALETLAMLWARNRRIAPAALLLGYLEARGPLYQHPYWVRLREHTLDPLRSEPRASMHMSRGAVMSQNQVLDVVLDELTRGEPEPLAQV